MTDNFFPWDEIPDSDSLPAGHLHFQVDSLEDSESSGGKRMFRAQFTCVAPPEAANMRYFENYVTGNDEAMGSIVPGQFGTKQLKGMLKAAQVPPSNDPNALCIGALNTQFIARMTINKDGENRISRYFRVGEKPAALDPVKPTVGGAGAVAMPIGVAPPAMGAGAVTPGPAVLAPLALPVTPAAPAPVAAPVAVVAPAPIAPPIVAPPAPVVPPSPAVVTPVVPAPSAVTPTAPTPTMECSICKQQVAVLEFSAHVQAHGG